MLTGVDPQGVSQLGQGGSKARILGKQLTPGPAFPLSLASLSIWTCSIPTASLFWPYLQLSGAQIFC